ncbi:hypothetical protein GFK26_27525 [Variovorax paradoxus]|uniref:Uncharacterized protein n=1 Tax=Variovorax paradoxus TaxID=34073 RepID=A0A5Q0MBH6_VARPD|nr:hypothetical protein [Variovorax paradoxus]QFZ86247.1 hypothetical protein GFK26_27525 [Variovorax paradoxus]
MSSTPTQISARIAAPVEFRAGDGPLLTIPEGPCQVIVEGGSAVLTWTEEGQPLSAAIPKIEFDRFVVSDAIILGTS